jgi:hypothetical protein
MNRIGGAMDIELASSAVYRGFEQSDTTQLVFVASSLSTHN